MESNPHATLTGCKLLILHIATKAENARNAKLRCTAGTRNFSLVDCRDLIDGPIGLCRTAQGSLHVPANSTPPRVISATKRIALCSRDQGGSFRPVA